MGDELHYRTIEALAPLIEAKSLLTWEPMCVFHCLDCDRSIS